MDRESGPESGPVLTRTVRSGAYDCDVLVIGGGIVGLSTAYAITRAAPGTRVTVLEKEPGPARHQTGRNSGVIHSGVYYRPGSLKARFAVRAPPRWSSSAPSTASTTPSPGS
ncbi:L-2-hydroxyglutarate dehydrogenase [Streptomyces tendae]